MPERIKFKKKPTTVLITAGSIDISVDIAVFCGDFFPPKGHKFSLTSDCLFRFSPEGELSLKLGKEKSVFQESFIKSEFCCQIWNKGQTEVVLTEGVIWTVLLQMNILLCIVFMTTET